MAQEMTRTVIHGLAGGLGALLLSPAAVAATLDHDAILRAEPLVRETPSGAVAIPHVAADLGTPLADAQLSDMRGKFITPDAISYFGVSLLTSWEDSAGVTTIARLLFNIDFLDAQTPTLLVGWVRDEGDPAMDVEGSATGYAATVNMGPDQVLPIGALDTLGGAAQANVIAGADNRTLNTLRIAIMPRDQVPDASAPGLSPITGSATEQFDDGDHLQFRIADNAIGLVMTGGGGLDSTLQSLGGDLGQVLQQTMLNTDNNNVLNSASIIFGLDAAQRAGNVRMDEAIMAMKGLGF